MISLDELIDYGANCMRCLTPRQFDDPSVAERFLETLVSREVFAREVLAAAPVIRVELIHTFGSETSAGVYESLAADLHRRWSVSEPAPLPIYWATRRTVRRLGGQMPGRLPNLDCISHDLGVSTVALTLFNQTPLLRNAWIPEERFQDVYGQAKPDAALADADGIAAYIEFAGRYSAERLQRLHEFALIKSRPVHLYTIAVPAT